MIRIPNPMTFRETTPLGDGDLLVVAGETVDLIAEASGHFWQTIWSTRASVLPVPFASCRFRP